MVFPDAVNRLFYGHVFLPKKQHSMLIVNHTQVGLKYVATACYSFCRYGYHDLTLLVSICSRIYFFKGGLFVSTPLLKIFTFLRFFKPRLKLIGSVL